MSKSIRGFQKLLIAKPAREQEHGERLVRLFEQAGLSVEELADDEAVLQHPAAERATSLLVLLVPSVGWITAASYGKLATRHGEHYLNPIMGCQASCTYCFLRATPRGLRPLRLHVGVDDLLRSLDAHMRDRSQDQSRLFCTGELADSLAELDIYPIAMILAEYFGNRADARFELRTKSNNVHGLLDVEHRGNTTVAFSISPQEHIDAHEPGTASLVERVEAGRQCQQAGYPVALKLEPLLLGPGWQQRYEDALALIAKRLDVSRIHHMSVGCLRWSKRLKDVPTFAKVHASTIELGDWIEYRPGTFNGTVARNERMAAYDWMRQLLRRHGLVAPIWWSLEEPELIAELERRDC